MQSTRVALVTGAARRVGRAIVQRLAEGGFDLAFTYLNSQTAADELAGIVRGMGRRIVAIRADFADPPAASAAVADTVMGEFGRLDVLVNNASVYEPSSLGDATLEQGRRMWAVHVETPLLLVRRLEPALRASRGRIINLTDLLAERPWPAYLLYSVTKAALLSLTLGLARALAPEVTVNAISPGAVQWPDDYPEEARRRYLSRVPLGRAGTPQDVAAIVHFLATEGSYITGQVLRVDGGRSIA